MPHGPDPVPLDPRLTTAPFRVADALAEGVPAKRLRAVDLDKRVRGVRASAGAADDVHGRCEMFAARLPGSAFFSHETAALLLAVPLPQRFADPGRALHVTVPSGQRAPHAEGLVGHSREVREGDVVEDGLRRSSAERMWCELSRALDVPDLVAVGDFLIHWRRPLTTGDALLQRVRASGRLGRKPRLLAAISLLSDRAESRPESLLRVLLLRAGLPTPVINHVVVDTERGTARRADFAYPELKIAIEYQGDYHRSKSQWRADMIRRRQLESQGWYVIEVNADDLRNPAALLAQLRAVIERRRRLFA